MVPPAEPVPALDATTKLRRSQRTAAAASKRAAKKPAPAPAPAPVPNPRQNASHRPATLKSARRGKPDKLAAIEGIGRVIESKLIEAGIFHYDQIASWSSEEAAWVSEEIGFPGRAHRENWMKQAAALAKTTGETKPARPRVAAKKPAPKPANPGKTG
jgi:predicted flap endonuclease-1-like 5' DNA nuclease